MLRAAGLLSASFVVATAFVATAAFAAAPPAAAPASAPAPAAEAPKATMLNCPVAVTGATTVIKDVDGGVELTVTGKGDVQAQIRTRSKALVDASKSTSATLKHDGKGDGGGRLGRCPVVMMKSTVVATDVEGGSKLTVKADAPADVAWLRTETRERNNGLVVAPAASGAGHGKMAHCPSAVEGASTKVTDGKDGVVVVITGKGDATVKEIRTRTKDLLTAAAAPDTTTAHAGDGKGGGALGRCPIVVKDTVLESKDVDGGAQVTVKAKKPADAAAVQKETRERAASFATTAAAAATPAPAKSGW